MNSLVSLLRESEFFEVFETEDLEALARDAVRLNFRKGDRIVEEGRPSERLFILVSGTFELSFLAPSEHSEIDPHVEDVPGRIVIHSINEPGALIGWSSMVKPYRCRATATALEATRVIAFERRRVEEHCQRQPEFGLRFVTRVLWALGDRIGSSRAQLAAKQNSSEARRVRELLAERGEALGVNSPLYKIPVYLENRLTAADAYDVLDDLAGSQDPLERDLALQCRQVIASAEREAQVFRQLQQIYDTVARAPDSDDPEEIRRACCEEFRKLYSLTDYRIEGWENLPADPGFIVLMNHLANHPESTLPNQFQLTLDTHFVTAMILYERYDQPPVRVVRQAAPDQAGHRRYFDRLGYISVTTGRPVGSPSEVKTKMAAARKQFLSNAQAVLNSGCNLVICPEGGSTTTKASPMAFRAGAFRVARAADPEPLLVPIAVANFDKPIARTRLAAKIFPPIRLSDSVPRSAPDETFYGFINELCQRYRGFVGDARRLAA